MHGNGGQVLLRARPPAKPTRHSPEAQQMADGQGEAAWGTSGEDSTRTDKGISTDIRKSHA